MITLSDFCEGHALGLRPIQGCEKERIEQMENERAYNEQMKRMKSQAPTTKADPWANPY